MKIPLESKVQTHEVMLLGVQAILADVLSELAKADPKFAKAIKRGIDNAQAGATEVMVTPGSKQVGHDVFGFIEEFRELVLG
jgi:hypothetical protein